MLRAPLSILTQMGEPSQRTQSGHKTVFTAPDGNEVRQALKTASDWPLRNSEHAVAFIVTDEGILFRSVTDKIPIGHPLRLHELELPPQVRAD
jgi:hypothetical protein